MPSVEFFYSERSKEMESWHSIYKLVVDTGYPLHIEPVKCDVSVVLNGKFVNPVPLYGKKILLYVKKDWSPLKWDSMFKPVLEEYYDEMINVEGRDVKKLIEEICQTNS